MTTLFHEPAPPAARKVMIATPAYAQVEAGYAFALFMTAMALKDAGHACELVDRL